MKSSLQHNGKKESGQILIIVAVAMVALLGFAALALDGGMYYSDRRYDQNAADESALAGAGAAARFIQDNGGLFVCGNKLSEDAVQVAETAAIQRAASNNFALTNNLDNQHGVLVQCGKDDTGAYIDVQVMVTSEVNTSFAHLFYKGKLKNTVEAMARTYAGGPFGNGSAIIALLEECHGQNGGVEFDGDALVDVGGDILSKACLVVSGGVSVSANGIYYVTDYDQHGASGDIEPTPEYKDPANMPDLPIFALECGSAQEKVKNGGVIEPGDYPEIKVSSKDLVMAPGLYCVDGDFEATGGMISVSGDDDDGVTIYIRNGNFSMAGNVVVNLRAAMNDSSSAIPGLLIYLAEGNTGEAAIQGTGDSSFRGTIFAPDGDIEVGGTGSSVSDLYTQFIGATVKIHGTSDMHISFDDDMIASSSSDVSLAR
jgi:hypothetical protein